MQNELLLLVAEHHGMPVWLENILFEDLARIPVEVEYASEFRYRNPVIDEDDVVIAISQSGETADTLAAIELAKSKGATIIGICNVVGSSIAARNSCRFIYSCRTRNWRCFNKSIYCTGYCSYLDGIDDWHSKKELLPNHGFMQLLMNWKQFLKKLKKHLKMIKL